MATQAVAYARTFSNTHNVVFLSDNLRNTLREVIRENGIEIASSCEQGACGTCLATVLEGDPIHQDVYLNDAEKRSGTKIMTCVSRARSARLVLDL